MNNKIKGILMMLPIVSIYVYMSTINSEIFKTIITAGGITGLSFLGIFGMLKFLEPDK